jgi:hypothetical protein
MTTNTNQNALRGFIKALTGGTATNNAQSIREQLLSLMAAIPHGTDFYNLCVAELVAALGVNPLNTATLKLAA